MSDDAEKVNRWEKAGIVGRLLHSWIFSLLRYGYKNSLEESDLYDCHEGYKAKLLADKLEKRWNQELEKKQLGKPPSFASAALSTFKVELLMLITIVAMQNCFFRILQSLALREVVAYYTIDYPTDSDYNRFLVLLFFLWVSIFGYSFLANHGYSVGSSIGTKIRTASTLLLYRKVATLGMEDTTDAASGQIVNLISNNMNRFEIAAKFCAYTIVAPLQLLISAILLWTMVGPGTLAGSAAFAIQFAFQVFVGKTITKMRKKNSKITDERVRLVSEVFSSIRIIKIYNWESPLFKRLKEVRHTELGKKLLGAIFNGTASDFAHAFGKLGVFFGLMVHFLLLGHPFSADALFMCTSMFENLRLAGRMFAFAITYQADTFACFKRIQTLLLTQERSQKDYKYQQRGNSPYAVSLNTVTSSWAKKSADSALNRISMRVKKGELVAVIGPIGSGKSSLLMSMMGELIQNEGSIEVEGRIAYVPQEAWLINKSVRDNVLLFSKFNDRQYAEALMATTLDTDVLKMEYRDRTPVGEKGANLSGGQRARVNLARAVCSDADIYLLDDPLSAVDAAVGKKIFENCIQDYLKGKTRILVTHQVQFLKTVDRIMVMEKGHIISCGTYDELIKEGVNLGLMTSEEDQEKAKTENKGEPSTLTTETPVSSETESNYNKIIDFLEDEEGFTPPPPVPEPTQVSAMTVFRKYFIAAGGFPTVLLLLTAGITAQACFNMIDLYLAAWCGGKTCLPAHVDHYNRTGTGPSPSKCPAYAHLLTSQDMYFNVYAVIVGCLVLFWLLRSVLFHVFCNIAARVLHKKAIISLLFAPISFFDVNPLGRILNRITKDVGNIDDVLPFMLSEGFLICLLQVGYVVVILLYFPIMAVGFAVLLAACIIFGKFYIKPGRDLQRLEAATSSPVFSMMAGTLKGLPLIRAHNGQELLFDRFAFLQNKQTSATICNAIAGSFYRTGVEFMSMFFLAIIFTTIALSKDIDAQISGLTLQSSTQIGIAIQYISLMVLQVITLMVSVERVLDYKKIEPEADNTGRHPPTNWPQSGAITFSNVYLKYKELTKTEKGEQIEKEIVSLKDLNFTINPGEKIGVVGRTGAGKSSLISSLMRLHQPEGQVVVDGINVLDVSLKNLRTQISVIPQEPVLFTGTLRGSLDPFGRYPDSRIWEALRMVQMDKRIREMNGSLDMYISDGGSNFSAGEKQLLCLTRAILLKNKILILDEASACLDFQSDQLIQTVIRHSFRDCTTIAVAHRLDTIIDSDRVMVMQAGELIEFDEPHVLLLNRNSLFSELVRNTGPSKEADLRKLAKEAHKRREKLNMDEDDNLIDEPVTLGRGGRIELRYV